MVIPAEGHLEDLIDTDMDDDAAMVEDGLGAGKSAFDIAMPNIPGCDTFQ